MAERLHRSSEHQAKAREEALREELEETQAASDGLARWVDRWPVSVDECAGRRRVGKSGWGGGGLCWDNF